MVFPFPIQAVENLYSLPFSIGLLVSISVLVGLCANHTKQYYRRKYTKETSSTSSSNASKIAPRSPPLLEIISNDSTTGEKADDDHRKNSFTGEGSELGRDGMLPKNDGGFGEGGVWQKSILMGEKCQPPKFTGVLFYDSCGNRISELPRSPRSFVQRFSSSLVEGDGQ